jgi:hypothetical protein
MDDSGSLSHGVMPSAQFTIEGGMVKLNSRYFGTYQVVATDPAIAEFSSQRGAVPSSAIAGAESPTITPVPAQVTDFNTPTNPVLFTLGCL